MASTVSTAQLSTSQHTLPVTSGAQAKAELRTTVGGSLLREVAADSLRRVTSQKNAAADLALSQGRLSSKLKDGTLTLKSLEAFGHGYAAEFGRALVKEYGSPDPTTQALSLLRQARACVDDAMDLLSETK